MSPPFVNKLRLFFLFIFLGANVCAQTFQWAKRMGDTNFQWGECIATDAAGNVYSSGRPAGAIDLDPGAGVVNATAPVYITKLTSAGNFVWAKCFGTGAIQIAAWSMTVDLAGNIYLAGSYRGTPDFDPGSGTFTFSASTTSNEGFLLKLSNTGNFLWAVNYEPSWANAMSVVTDASNNVYVAGDFNNTMDVNPAAAVYNLIPAGGNDAYITKLSPAGAFIWAKRIGGADSDYAMSVNIDGAGNVLVTGAFTGTVDFDPNAGVANLAGAAANVNSYVLKLNSAGNFVWARRMGGPANDSYGSKVSFDGSNNVYIAGIFQGTADFDPGAGIFNLTSAGSNDFFVCKLTPAGSFTWARRMGGINDDRVESMDIDSYGNVYTSGCFEGTVDFDPGAATVNRTSSGGSIDMFIHKMNTSGNYAWVWAMGSAGYEIVNGIALDGSNNLYSTGCFENTVDFNGTSGTFNMTSAGGYDIFINKIGNTTPLPIELLSFNVVQNKNMVDVTWQTSSETNNDYFTIERSKDGNEFEEAGRVEGSGNSSILLSYSFTDKNPYSGVSYYRLKQTDFNGEFSYSETAAVSVTAVNTFLFYQDHVKSQVICVFKNSLAKPFRLSIHDLTGRAVFKQNLTSETTLIRSVFLPGTYIASVENGQEVFSQKLIIR